jgi:hypothetical protein
VWRNVCISVTDNPSPCSASTFVWNLLKKEWIFHKQILLKLFSKNLLITTRGFHWEQKKDLSAENKCSSGSTAGEIDSHLVSQWHNICLYSISTNLQNSFNVSVLTVQTEK